MTLNTKKSFRFKLIVYIVITCAFVFAMFFSGSLYFSAKQVINSTENIITSKLSLVNQSLESGLGCTEVSSDNVMHLVKSNYFKKSETSGFDFMHECLNANPRCCGIAFGYNPDLLPGERGYAPYVRRNDDGTFTDMNLADRKAYFEYKWYSEPAKTGKPEWADPFIESNGNLITSYNVPYYDKNNRLIGVLAMDLDLKVVSDSIQTLRPFPNSRMYVLDRRGRFLAHPDYSYVYSHSVDPEIRDQVMSGEVGYTTRKEGKEDIYIFYAPQAKTGWTIMMEVPESEMSHDLMALIKQMVCAIILGLIILLGVCFGVIGKLTKPIETFAAAAKKIAQGHFDVELPPIKDHNELFDLRQALAAMEVDLNSYIGKLEDTTKREARIENELNIARGIQTSMVPKVFPPSLPHCRNLDIFAAMKTAQEVGGDLYDFVIFGNKLYFCIGDVSGKGVPASLFMAITRSLFRNLASEGKTPGQIACSLNDSICQSNELSMFITMFIGSLNLDNGETLVCNCGHNHPVIGRIVPPGQPAELSTFYKDAPTNIPIGVMDGFKYVETSHKAKYGDMLLLYTDGITEAENQQKNLYGDDRLLTTVSDTLANTCGSARIIIDRTLESVHAYAAGAVQNDDITALCIIYTEK